MFIQSPRTWIYSNIFIWKYKSCLQVLITFIQSATSCNINLWELRLWVRIQEVKLEPRPTLTPLTHTVAPTCCCLSVGPTRHLTWITNGIIWIVEHDSGLKLVHHRAVSLVNHMANVLHSQNESWPFFWMELIKLKWLVWLILSVTLEGWTK